MKEYKIIKVDYDRTYEKAEKTLNEMAQKGWEVVSVASEPINSVKVVITLCREV